MASQTWLIASGCSLARRHWLRVGGNTVAIVNPRLSTVPVDELMHVFFVVMLCVQENSVERPAMREVVQMGWASSTVDACRQVPRRGVVTITRGVEGATTTGRQRGRGVCHRPREATVVPQMSQKGDAFFSRG
ncbi:hypothetical protein B296_00044517 [Ensete ventricosum]|uniref:Serine-threonine/tyrosine-protein kinase catalytic domain-containing protein n=1 Tax=Ensete ventricosum TaxID=4639 RepID=A0A426ZAV3_ENSVE|nr:hypothetical protein B296_00044517 [Ensete ventricosum]